MRCYRRGRLPAVGIGPPGFNRNIAEDVIYLVGGHIVRHEEKKRLKQQGLM